MKEDIIRTAKEDCTYLITMPGDVSPEAPDSFIWSYPFDRPSVFAPVLTKEFYGEAEAQLAVCIKHSVQHAMAAGQRVPRTALYTIDTDALYQMLGLWHPRLEVVLGNVWETPDGQLHRSLKRAQKATRDIKAANKKRKRDDSKRPPSSASIGASTSPSWPELVRRVGGQDANAQWWQLSRRCDYNLSGLSGFGWFNSTCLKLQTDAVIDREGLHVHTFATILFKDAETSGAKSERWPNFARCWRGPFSAGNITSGTHPTRLPRPPIRSIIPTCLPGAAKTVTEWLRAVRPNTVMSLKWRPT